MDPANAQRHAIETKRSYRFVMAASVLGWAIVVGVLVAHSSVRGASVVAVLVVTAALLGWLAFLRGHLRRDLSRIEGLDQPTAPRSYDPRSK